jgi:KaiC/GvpD/RAD55 family RecA-like ATPase
VWALLLGLWRPCCRHGEILILVDTDTSKENVSRAATSQGWQVKDVQPEGEGYRIKIGKD